MADDRDWGDYHVDRALETIGRVAIDVAAVARDIERLGLAPRAAAREADRLRELGRILDDARRTLRRRLLDSTDPTTRGA